VPKKAYINLFDNAHNVLEVKLCRPKRVSMQYVILGWVAE